MTTQGNFLVAASDIPDLSSLKPHSLRFALLRMLAGSGSRDPVLYALMMNCVRLVDHSISEYELARKSVIAFDKDPPEAGVSHVLSSSARFETCIMNAERALKHLQAIRASSNIPANLRGALKPVDKADSLLHGNNEGRFTKMRNAVVHLERDILDGKVPKGKPHCLVAKPGGLIVGDECLPYAHLAKCLKELHAFAAALTDYREPGE